MNKINNQLLNDETIIKKAKTSYLEIILNIFMLIIAYFLIPIKYSYTLITPLILAYLNTDITKVVLTNKRILITKGIISIESDYIFLNKIESIYIEEGIIGKIFRVGRLVIYGTDSGKCESSFIIKPNEFLKLVNNEILNLNKYSSFHIT